MAVLIVPPMDLAFPTLGPQVAQFIEERCVFGKGPLEAEPARLDDEKRALLYRMYEVFPQGHELSGMRRFHRCALELRKGLAKTEFASWVVFCELHPEGPVRCDGFDASGNPVGRPVRSPYIPMMATTEGQVEDLAYGVLRFIVENSPDADLFKLSDERIIRLGWNGSNAGEALAVSNAPGARDGARTTFQHFDEPHRLHLQRQLEAHNTMNENLPKLQMEDPWSLYTSTAGKPGIGSIQENLRAEAEAIDRDGKGDRSFFFFSRWAGPEHDDLSTVEKRVAAIVDATGPCGEWGRGQFLRIAEGYDSTRDKPYWERVWLNRWIQSGSQAFNMPKVEDLKTDEAIPKGAFISVGFDGARFRDATAIVITDIETGRQELYGVWEKPDDVEEWEVDGLQVMEVVDEIMRDYEVWRMYCDPYWWFETVASWAAKYPDRVIEWATGGGSFRRMANAISAYVDAIDTEAITYPPRNRAVLFRHMGHAGRKELPQLDDQGVPLWVMQKQDGRLANKFDAAMAAVLSWQACIDARREGAKPKPKGWMPRQIY